MTLKELMEKATPRPWQVDGTLVADPDECGIMEPVMSDWADGLTSVERTALNEANATFVVHCVNNFAQVVEALETALAFEDIAGRDEEPWMPLARAALTAAQNIPSGEKEGDSHPREEWMCVKCNRNTAGCHRVRLKKSGVFVASMHSECAFGVPWAEDAVAEPATPSGEKEEEC